jgi:hypothetical protein
MKSWPFAIVIERVTKNSDQPTLALKWFLVLSCHFSKPSTMLVKCICNPSGCDFATNTFNKPKLTCIEKHYRIPLDKIREKDQERERERTMT